MTPWTSLASYAPRPVISPSAEHNARMVDEMLDMLGAPATGVPMDRKSKITLLAVGFVLGVFIALQIGA